MERIPDIYPYAKARIPLIKHILETGGNHYLRREEMVEWPLRVLWALSFGQQSFDVRGIENKNKFEEAGAKRKIVICNHATDADPATIRAAFRSKGLEDFINNSFYTGGVNMVFRPVTRIFLGADELIIVPTPHEIEATKQALAENSRGKEERDLIERYEESNNLLAVKSQRDIVIALREKKNLIMFPEGGRTLKEDGTIDWAPEETGGAADRKGNFILPMAMKGLRDRYPPHRWPSPGPLRVVITIGEPFDGTKVHGVDRNIFLNGRPANRGTALMSEIAALDPEIVDPDEREFYSKVKESLDPKTPRFLKPEYFGRLTSALKSHFPPH